MTLDEIVDGLIKTAKNNLELCAGAGTDFCHVAFPLILATPIGMSILPLSGEPDERHKQVTDIHRNLELNGCDALIIITDSWKTVVPEGMTPEEAMRQRRMGILKPEEGLMTLVCSKDQPAKTITSPYKRVGTKIEWGHQEECLEFDSWMVPPQWSHNVAKGSA